MSILASLIGGAATVGGGILSSYLNHRNDMNLLAYQNKYNSPVEQMKRGKAAGINPNALAQGIAGSPGYGNMAPANAADVSSVIPNNLGQLIGDATRNVLNARQVEANIENTKEDTRGKRIQNDYDSATLDTRIDQAFNEGVITEAQAKNAKLFAEKYPDFIDTELDQKKAELDKTRAEKNKIEKEIEVSDQKIRESEKLIAKYEQDIRTSKSQEAKNYAEAAVAREQKNLEAEKARNQELRNTNLEVSGEETGWKAEYFAIESKEGREAADKWLEINTEVLDKVVQSTSKAQAEGAQEVYDNTPQGQLKRVYEHQMNRELAQLDKDYAHLRGKKDFLGSSFEKEYNNKRERIIRKYRNKMRRVDKGFSGGLSAFGFGANAGG